MFCPTDPLKKNQKNPEEKIQVPLCDPISLLINTFGIHLEPGGKSHEQIIHYLTLKMSKNKRQFCSIFRRILIKSPGRDFLLSDL